MNPLNLLVIDDDPLIPEALRLILPENWSLDHYTSLKPEILKNQMYHAAFIDMHLSGDLSQAEGLEVISHVIKKIPQLEVVAMSGNLDRELMESCLKNGATRFLAKPLSTNEVLLILDKIEALHLLKSLGSRHFQSASPMWVGDSGASQSAKTQIANFTGEKGPILIEGETGTGKEVTANLIHMSDQRGPFIRVNIAAIPESLFESEFFGHVRGAFTGAHQNKVGLAEAAHGGDLFIDEIEALSLNLQVKLLRFLETGEVRRVGSSEAIHVQTRVIIATNKNLDEMVQSGEFREDLLWRITHQKILLPPLRERAEDIETLAKHFINSDSARKKALTNEALEVLQSHSWPGNIRELKRVCEQLILNAPLPFIRREDVENLIPTNVNNKINIEELDSQNLNFNSLADILAYTEKNTLQKCLKKYDNNLQKVGEVLNISRSSLYKKLKDYAIPTHNESS